MRKQKRKQKTFTSSRDSRLPLDRAFTQQRGLELDGSPLDAVRLKSATRSSTIFRKRIAQSPSRAQHGDLVRVLSDDGALLGTGLWNPRAEATIRMLTRGEQLPDVPWWQERLRGALALRREILKIDEATTAYRLLNADGDGVPGLVADRYGDIISLETFSLGMYQRAEAISRLIASLLHVPHWIVRPGPQTEDQEGFIASGFQSGQAPGKILITEHGLRYEVLPFEGHKTGFFCDQRDNRLRLRQFCEGASVLDLCCYSGGFSVNASHAGAQDVTGVDLDETAIDAAQRNANLNQCRIRFVHADAFAYMRDMQRNGRQYRVVILDPPKLIRGRKEYDEGLKKYLDLNRLAVSLVEPGGILLTCSCSGLLNADEFTKTVRAATGDRPARLLFRTGASPDHPVAMSALEGEYLKCLWLQVDR